MNNTPLEKSSRSVFQAVFSLAVFSLVLGAGGCARKSPEQNEISAVNLVKVGVAAPRHIGDTEVQFTVTPKNLLAGQGLAATSNALILGLPMSLLGKQNVFGGVITKVSDRNSQDLGMLKLTDLPPMPVVPKLEKNKEGVLFLGLYGCVSECTADKESALLASFPVLSVDVAKQLVQLDLSAVGRDFDLFGILDPDGKGTKLKSRSAQTVAVDYSQSTLVFDVDSHMIPTTADKGDASVAETVFTTRWYLKLNPVTDANFVSRAATDGVGFFKTLRGVSPKITRFSADAGPIKYYLKNIPQEFQPAFQAAFDGWNKELQSITGKPLLTYEFVNTGDSREPLLVPGDVRYNIVAWDMDNRAPYGGLGPSIADQLTGQTFAATVLVQGPHITEMYKKWYSVSENAQSFLAKGMPDAAEQLIVQAKREAQPLTAMGRVQLNFGKNLSFRVVSQLPELTDPLMERDDFDLFPTNITFDNYMTGYFKDMIAHELGHNLGLRHNFRGTLGATSGVATQGSVSRSIMDYMSRDYRFLDQVGDYDRMALAYGYGGVQPAHTDWFCADEDTADPSSVQNSAECSKDDATDDPFSFFEGKLTQSINLLTNHGQGSAPNWSVADMNDKLRAVIGGLLNYASSAAKTASGWTNFFGKFDRPNASGEVKAYVVDRIRAQLCGPSLQTRLTGKVSQAAKDATLKNIADLKAKVAEIAKPYSIFKATEFDCR